MSGRERDAQTRSNEQHGNGATGARGEEFGVTGEGDAGVVDDALVHRRGNHGIELAFKAAIGGTREYGDHAGGIAFVELAGHDGRARRNMYTTQHANGARGTPLAVVRFDR